MRRLLAMARITRAATTVTFVLFAHALFAQATVSKWKAVEEWRVDGSEVGEPFSSLRDYVVLRDGTLWVLDFKDQIIRRYSATGKPLSVVGHKGAGPGEMYNANGMAVDAAGSVWVNDPNNGRLTVFTPDGKFARQVVIPIHGYGYRWDGWFLPGGNEIVQRRMAGEKDALWEKFDASGKPVGTWAMTTCSSGAPSLGSYSGRGNNGNTVGSYPMTLGGGLAPDSKGNVWCAFARATRAVLIKAGSTDTIATTNIDIAPLRVDATERTEAIALVEKQLARYPEKNFDASKVPFTKPGIAALFSDDDGRLWVMHSMVFHVNSALLDVFTASGKHLGRITIPSRINPYLPIRARGDALWLTILDGDDVPSVVRYRLVH